MAALSRKIPKEVQTIFDKYIEEKSAKRLKKADAVNMLEVSRPKSNQKMN